MSFIPEESSEFDFFIGESRPKSMFGTEQSYKVAHQYSQPLEDLFDFGHRYQQSLAEDNERMPQETIKEMQKMKNRLKAKKFRDKKKVMNDLAFSKIKELESENSLLKQTKTLCGRCKTRVVSKSSITPIHEETETHNLQFEPPKLAVEKPQNGRIWIALGIIMLIIGVNIHGFNKQPIEINLHHSLVNKIQKELQSGSQKIKIPFALKQKSDLFKQVPPPDRKIAPAKKPILLIESEGSEVEGYKSEEMVEISKDFIMRLHGEINDIGNYL